MSTDRDTTRIVRLWLRTDEHESADRVLDAVLDRLDTTPQRRATSWPVRRLEMNTTAKLALGAAAALLIALVGIRFLVPADDVGLGGPPTPSPTPTATPQPLSNGPLDAGTVIATGLGPSEGVSATFTVPEGWEGFAGACVLPITGTVAPDGMGICFSEVDTVLHSDPCHVGTGSADVAVGPTVDELATALGEQTAYEATEPTDVTLGGYSGKRMDLQLPSDVASCNNGEFYPWSGSIYAQGPDNRWHLWILDVEGDRLVVMSTSFAGTPAEDLAEQQAIVDSIRLEP